MITRESVLLKDITIDVQPGFASGETDDSGILQIRMNNIETDGKWNWEKERRVPVPKNVDRFLAQPGDIIFNATNSPDLVGKLALFSEPLEDTTFSNHFMRLRLDQKKADPGYITRFLQFERERGVFSHICKKWVNQASVSREDLLSRIIPLPPLPEQKRIAGILDQADALRRLRARALEKLSTLGQAIFQEMFGDPRTNPRSWPVKSLTALGELERGVSKHRPRNDPALLDGEHPLIQTGDVSRARDYVTSYSSSYSDAGLRQSRKWPKGTLCITIAANIADTAILDFDACFPDSVVGFNSGNAAMNFFIHRWFKTAKGHLEDIAPAVAQKNINLAILRDLPIITPPQGLIENFFRHEQALRQQATVAARSASLFASLFMALQHRAFRGEL